MSSVVAISNDKSSQNALEHALESLDQTDKLYVVHVGKDEEIVEEANEKIEEHGVDNSVVVETIPKPPNRSIHKQLVIFAEKTDSDHLILGSNDYSLFGKLIKGGGVEQKVSKLFSGKITLVDEDNNIETI